MVYERIIHRIRKLCISGGKLKAMHVKRRHRPLYVAARTHFGSWRAALEAAGINPEHAVAPLRRITRQEILEVIRQRHQAGLSLVRCDVFCANRACVVAAKHLFGSWSKALTAAGIPPEEGRRPGNQYRDSW